ncbi:DUF692 family multinuclear iron-containing protein [Limnohabitans sp. B9-3]|uniref:DUF692 domain-containing protein n=1 Tax=Limnohabitans sp. B9-3 TaxID=1100707 RepID=UPI000C1F8728|nr:DUF692 family multinuclear iron-containing protein [Limnohabitans sp. B9-3]PIT73049.1 hypothetical protein B9Z42_12240 [Limnohabitans sp. B9-3]
MNNHRITGIGLALKPVAIAVHPASDADTTLRDGFASRQSEDLQFIEVAAEQWLGMGGPWGQHLREATQRWPSVCVSQSLSLGGPGRLDMALVHQLATFVRGHEMAMFSEALSWSDDDAPLFTCLPIPATTAALQWTADRIMRVQDALGQSIGIRNVSHHAVPPMSAMHEAAFISALVAQTGCHVHLDITALAENSHRFGFDALQFLAALPMQRVNYVRLGGAEASPIEPSLNSAAARLLPAVLSHLHPEVPVCVDDWAQLKRWSDAAVSTSKKTVAC